MAVFVRVGNVILSSLEIPQELPGLGTKQVTVKHMFPGGEITIQPLGAFPHDAIEWSGIMTGADASGRLQRLQRLAALGIEVGLSWGAWAWSGVVTKVEGKARHQFYIPYGVTFEPTADLSGIGTVPTFGISPDILLGSQVTALDNFADGADGLDAPAGLVTETAALDAVVQTGLLQGNGTVAGISTANALAVKAQVAVMQATAQPLFNDADPSVASPALDMAARATLVGTIVANPNPGVRIVRTVNPNLFALAAQYLGDAARWGDIATASGITDPQPVGMFTLTVPAL